MQKISSLKRTLAIEDQNNSTKYKTMRNVRNITETVTPELYRQTRMLAVEYDTTVTALVAYLLERMPPVQNVRYVAGSYHPTPPP